MSYRTRPHYRCGVCRGQTPVVVREPAYVGGRWMTASVCPACSRSLRRPREKATQLALV